MRNADYTRTRDHVGLVRSIETLLSFLLGGAYRSCKPNVCNERQKRNPKLSFHSSRLIKRWVDMTFKRRFREKRQVFSFPHFIGKGITSKLNLPLHDFPFSWKSGKGTYLWFSFVLKTEFKLLLFTISIFLFFATNLTINFRFTSKFPEHEDQSNLVLSIFCFFREVI